MCDELSPGLKYVIEVNYASAHAAILAIRKLKPSICTYDPTFQRLLSFGTESLSQMIACVRALPSGGDVGSPYIAACIDDLVDEYCRLLENHRVAAWRDNCLNRFKWDSIR